MRLLLFVLLVVVCWPAALALVVLYPLVWLLLLPFRLVGLAVKRVLDIIGAVFQLPLKALRAL